MFKNMSFACLAGVSFLAAGIGSAEAIERTQATEPRIVFADQPPQRIAQTRNAYAAQSGMGGGFIEFLFGGGGQRYQPSYDPRGLPPMDPQQGIRQQEYGSEIARPAFDPRFEKQVVEYSGKHGAGTIVVDTPNKFLYLVQDNGTAVRYGIGVGRPGFTWSGVKQISAKKEWPAWTPPPEMLARRPDLPRHMEGGPDNPLGARAMYLGSSLYRIHGSNEPWTIGTNVSSGCIRMRNEDVIDLYGRVNVGATVVVI
jgi:lipoprotein-anchoring transpeptidase ErfK/SrfK